MTSAQTIVTRIAVLVLVGLTGCSGHGPKEKSFVPPDPHGWFIESYDSGVFTVQHDGYTYLIKCTRREIFWPEPRASNKYSTCDEAFRQVGHVVQPHTTPITPEGNQPDSPGRTVKMWLSGKDVVLQTWHDKSHPTPVDEFVAKVGGVSSEGTQEIYEIISIKKSQLRRER